MDEVKLACILTLDYEFILSDEMLFNAVERENEYYEWLFIVWATRKNFIGDRAEGASTMVTFEHLFDIIIRHYATKVEGEKQREYYIKTILDWKIVCIDDITNNIIRCLLAHHLDVIAVEYMGEYHRLLNKELLIYCIDHGNYYFLQHALVSAAFDKLLFREESVIEEILTIL
jgi:hypothetical protein